MLERHIVLLKAAVQEMYAQLQHCHAWVGPVLSETIGHPSIHDILAGLDLRQHADEGDHHGNVCKPGVAALHISIGGGAGALKHSQGNEQHLSRYGPIPNPDIRCSALIFPLKRVVLSLYSRIRLSTAQLPRQRKTCQSQQTRHPQVPTASQRSVQGRWRVQLANGRIVRLSPPKGPVVTLGAGKLLTRVKFSSSLMDSQIGSRLPCPIHLWIKRFVPGFRHRTSTVSIKKEGITALIRE